MQKEEEYKKVVESIIKESKKISNFSRRDIEKGIVLNCGKDRRTINSWFDALILLDYFIVDSETPFYHLNFEKVKLYTLSASTHTHKLSEDGVNE